MSDKITADNAERMTCLARLGKWLARQVVWSPNQQTLAMASLTGVYLYDAQTHAQVRLLEHPAPVWVALLNLPKLLRSAVHYLLEPPASSSPPQ
ncbi:MAG: hypothetical protein HYR71_05955 [Chloroflexi bacterium]|nr:hypothetical protein [Chloroflexota bacterium]